MKSIDADQGHLCAYSEALPNFLMCQTLKKTSLEQGNIVIRHLNKKVIKQLFVFCRERNILQKSCVIVDFVNRTDIPKPVRIKSVRHDIGHLFPPWEYFTQARCSRFLYKTITKKNEMSIFPNMPYYKHICIKVSYSCQNCVLFVPIWHE